MKMTIFAKKGQSRDGRTFFRYLGRLIRKSTGETVTVAVKFRETAGHPDAAKCPMNIEFSKADANYTEKEITRDDGSTIISREIWISAWKDAGAFVDTSMDDFV